MSGTSSPCVAFSSLSIQDAVSISGFELSAIIRFPEPSGPSRDACTPLADFAKCNGRCGGWVGGLRGQPRLEGKTTEVTARHYLAHDDDHLQALWREDVARAENPNLGGASEGVGDGAVDGHLRRFVALRRRTRAKRPGLGIPTRHDP